MFRTIQNVSFSVTWVHQGVFTENPVFRASQSDEPPMPGLFPGWRQTAQDPLDIARAREES
jgi:hypothetical protein